MSGLLDKLEGINQRKLADYKERLAENNINGVVLSQCELSELKTELKMAFGDWELFRSLVEVLRDKENSTSAYGKGNRAGLAGGKFMRTFDEEDDGGANSPHIRFTSDVPPKEKKLEAPTPFYPAPVEAGTSSEFPLTPTAEGSGIIKEPVAKTSSGGTPGKSDKSFHKSLSQQSSAGSTRSLARDDFVDEFIFETQSIHDVMEDMGMTDDESNDMEDTDPDSEVYDTVIHMPDDKRPEIPATLLQDQSQSKADSSSLSTPGEKFTAKSPSEQARAKFIVSAAKDDTLGIEMGDLMNRLKEKHSSYIAAASAMSSSQTSNASSETENLAAQAGSVKSPRYSSDSSSDSMSTPAFTQVAVAAEINPATDSCFYDADTSCEDVTAPLLTSKPPRKPVTPRSEVMSSRERLGPRLMEKLEKLSMDLEEEDPELTGYQQDRLGLAPTDKTPLMTPATSREHLNVRKANKVKDETGPSAFQVVTPGSSRASSLAASAASSRCGSLSGTPLPVSPAVLTTEGMDYFALEQRPNWKKISPSSGLSRKGSTGSLNKQEKSKPGTSSSGMGSPAGVASPGTPKTSVGFAGGSGFGSGPQEGVGKASEGKEVIVNVDGKTVKMSLPKDESFI